MGYIYKKKTDGLAMREPGQEDGSQSRNATGAGAQLSSGNNPAGGVRTSREGTRRAKTRISRCSKEEGRERRERFDRKDSRESKKSQGGSRWYCDREEY